MARLRSLAIELASLDPQQEVFGAAAHGYGLRPASSEVVATFESRRRVRLPTTFRSFLLEVTNGGPGPGYGLFALDRDKEDDVAEDLEFLAQPFDESFLTERAPEVDPEEDEAAYEAAMNAYWRHMPGTMTLCHYGCAIRAQLVVTGRLAGQVLLDRRTDADGICVALFNRAQHGTWNGYGRAPEQDSTPLDFAGWYEDWLRASLARVQGVGAKNRAR